MSDQQRQALDTAIRHLEACIKAMKKANESLCEAHDFTPEDDMFGRAALSSAVANSNAEIRQAERRLQAFRTWWKR